MPEPIVTQLSPLRSRWYLFILLALLGRGIYIGVQVHEFKKAGSLGVIAVDGDDSGTYLEPIENVLAGRGYLPDYRMPGLGTPYALFRLVLGEAASHDALVVLQWLLSSISVYILALITQRITGSERASLVVFTVFLLSSYACWYDSFLISDSLAVSSLILLVYSAQRAVDGHSTRWFIVSGLLLTWFIFLRPVGILLLPLIAVLVLRHLGWRGGMKPVAAMILPFLLIDGAWTYRNYTATGKLMPLTNQGIMPAHFKDSITGSLMRFVQGYGGDYIWWNIGSDMRWFGVCLDFEEIDGCGERADPPPAHALVDAYTMDSLLMVRSRIRLVHSGTLSTSDSSALKAGIVNTLDRYALAYRTEAPGQYYFWSRIRMVGNLLRQNGTETLFNQPWSRIALHKKVFKVVQSGIYMLSVAFGTLAAFIVLFRALRRTQNFSLELSSVAALCLMAVYPIGLLMCEWRYMVHHFPLLLMLGAHLLLWVRSNRQMRWVL